MNLEPEFYSAKMTDSAERLVLLQMMATYYLSKPNILNFYIILYIFPFFLSI